MVYLKNISATVPLIYIPAPFSAANAKIYHITMDVCAAAVSRATTVAGAFFMEHRELIYIVGNSPATSVNMHDVYYPPSSPYGSPTISHDGSSIVISWLNGTANMNVSCKVKVQMMQSTTG